MSELRAIIRELLTEELEVLRAELLGRPQAERVSVGTESELTGFAMMIARRARDEPEFMTALEAGRIRFAPAAVPSVGVPHSIASAQTVAVTAPANAPLPTPLVAPSPPPVPELRKRLITERDIAAVEHGEKRLRIIKNARMTPLAADEARRRGIRIERTLA